MRLIDADKLETELINYYDVDRQIITAVKAQPTVNASPVVRCSECKWYKFVDDHSRKVCTRKHFEPIRSNDFCSYGARE